MSTAIILAGYMIGQAINPGQMNKISDLGLVLIFTIFIFWDIINFAKKE